MPKITLVEDPEDFAVTDLGEATIRFPERLIVPAQWQNIKEREVAFDPRLRRLKERTETLLTDTGFVDFKIRPALEFNIVGSDTGA